MADRQWQKLLRNVGTRIRERRKSCGISQRQLATRTAVDRGFLSAVERGQRNVSLLLLWRVAQALDLSVEQLICDRQRDRQS
jgi:transcriptional regulator with XRE-family HTH domain